MNIGKARLAWRNILSRMNCRKNDDVLIVFDQSKQDLARVLAQTAASLGMNPYMLVVPAPSKEKFAPGFVKFLRDAVKTEFVVVLLSYAMLRAKGIMEVIGRPDQGYGEVGPRFFCDWALHADSFVRVNGADPTEIGRYRTALLKRLSTGEAVRVVTDLGTDVRLRARYWLGGGDAVGEVCTAPVEGSAEGVLVYDASMYWGPPQSPIRVAVEGGRIRQIACLGPRGKQYRFFTADSKKDKGASVLAELGIGINPRAEPRGDGMEAEQARGTCHFDFGNNIAFGGRNRSCIHYGGVVSKPTVYVDGHVVLEKGTLIPRKDG